MNNPFMDKSNSEIVALVNEYIHSQRDRELLVDRYTNGYTFEKLGEMHNLSTVQTKRIIYKQTEAICNQIRTYSF